MDTTFMNSENSKIPDFHKLLLKQIQIDIDIREKYFSLSNLRIYYTSKNITKSYNNSKFKISKSMLSETFLVLLPHVSCFISDI